MGIALPPPEQMATWRTLDQAAKQLGVSRRTISQWISDRKIRAYTIPGDKHRYVDMDEVKKFRQPRPIEPGEEGNR